MLVDPGDGRDSFPARRAIGHLAHPGCHPCRVPASPAPDETHPQGPSRIRSLPVLQEIQRLYDTTNDKVIATSVQGNLGNSGSPAIVDLGALSDLPIGQAILEIQIVATDSNGDPDPAGKRKVGIHTFQLF